MTKNILLVAVLLCYYTVSAQVGIGTDTPDPSSQLDIQATDKGLLSPRMTESQRTAILTPATGLLVFQTDNAAGFYYYTGSAWVAIATTGVAVPAGTIAPFAGTVAPAGWAFCNGQELSRSSYPQLFSTLSTVYGSGNGSSTFNLPDLRGRAAFGKDDMGGTAANRLTTAGGINGTTLGAAGGAQAKTLAVAELPTHSHTYKDAYFAENHNTSGRMGGGSRYGTAASTDNDNSFYFRTTSEGHTGDATSSSTNISTSNTGSGNSFSLVNPGIVLNYIIKL